jgi:hypothetical protein
MSFILIACGFGLVILPGLTRGVGRCLRPSTWATMCITALVGGTALTEIGLLFYAAPTTLRAVGGARLADLCQRTLDLLVPGGPVAGWFALSGAALIAGGCTIGVCKARRVAQHVRVESSLGTHEPIGDHELVVLPAEVAFAVSLTGKPGQVVVSKGLIDTLTEGELAVVLRHEKAHLDLGHQSLLRATSAVEHGFFFFPAVQSSTRALRCAIERWADEVATSSVPEGRDLLRQALIKVARSLIASTIAAFSGVDTVAERLEALDAPPPRPSALSLGVLFTPGLLLGGTAMAGLVVCIASVWTIVAMAGHCPL